MMAERHNYKLSTKDLKVDLPLIKEKYFQGVVPGTDDLELNPIAEPHIARVDNDFKTKMNSYFHKRPPLFGRFVKTGVYAVEGAILPQVEKNLTGVISKSDAQELVADYDLLQKYKARTNLWFNNQALRRGLYVMGAVETLLTARQLYNAASEDGRLTGRNYAIRRNTIRALGELSGSVALSALGARLSFLRALGGGYLGTVYGGRLAEAGDNWVQMQYNNYNQKQERPIPNIN